MKAKYLTNVGLYPPGGEVHTYGAGGRGSTLLRRLSETRPDIRVAGFLDSFRDGALDGLPVRRAGDFLSARRHGQPRVLVATHAQDEVLRLLGDAGVTDVMVFVDLDVLALSSAIRRLYGSLRFTLVDCGACDLGDYPFWPLFSLWDTTVYGFEPASAVVESVDAGLLGYRAEVHPVGLGRERGRAPFYECPHNPTGSSLLRHNTAMSDRLTTGELLYADLWRGITESSVDLVPLDEWCAQNRVEPDFIKLNIEGAELDVLRSGTTALSSALGLITEAAMVELRAGNPYFADVNTFLRQQGLTFFQFIGLMPVGRAAAPFRIGSLPRLKAPGGQAFSVDALYLRDAVALRQAGQREDLLCTEKLLKLAVAAEVFGQIEYAFEVLALARTLADRDGDVRLAPLLADIAALAEAEYRRQFGEARP